MNAQKFQYETVFITNILNLKKMKSKQIMKMAIALSFLLICNNLMAQVGGWNPERVQDSKQALKEMVEANPKLQSFQESSYAFTIFPRVTKGGFVFGGAVGNGVVFRNNQTIGSSKLKQASWGLQAGGQQYSEVIFFEDVTAFENFINGKLKFDGQASAVALKSGASINAAYHESVAIFTKAKGGLMYEASIGGQHFKYQSID